jgi:hypothetical protein
MNIYKKLQTARVMLQELNLKKSGLNKFAGFRYFELGDFVPYINNIFDELSMMSAFNIHNDIATLTIVNADKPDEMVVFSSPTADASVKGTTPVQSLGAVHTYLKRYLYVNALEIIDGDVLDAAVGSGKLNADRKKELVDKIEKLIEEKESDDLIKAVNEQAATKYKVDSWSKLPTASLEKVLVKLEEL